MKKHLLEKGKDILHTLRVLGKLMKIQFSASMMYRYSFWVAFLGDGTLFLLHLLFFGVIAQSGSFNGWNIHHFTVFIGAFTALDGLYMATYFFGIISLPDKIRTGTLDLMLIKPVNALLYTTLSSIDLGSFTLVALGFGMAFYGGYQLGVLSFAAILQFLVVFLLMYLLMYALMLCLRCLSFWLTKVDAFHHLEDQMVSFSFRLPAPAIQGVWRLLLFAVLPYGLMANMPAQALFGPFGLLEWALCLGVTLVFLSLSLFLWKVGIKRYDSASS